MGPAPERDGAGKLDMTLAALPELPPLLTAIAAPPGLAALTAAAEMGASGADPGAVVFAVEAERLEMAVLLAPEEPLERALTAALALAQGATDALGALGPPEMAVLWRWPDLLEVNGARCGRLRAAAPSDDLGAIPDWMALGLEIALLADPDPAFEPGARPDRTCLAEEGAGDLGPSLLGGAVARHFLRWLHDRETEGLRALAEEWCGRAVGRGGDVRLRPGPPDGAAADGRWLGLDETGGLMLRSADGVRIAPLARLLDRSRLADPAPMLDVLAPGPRAGSALRRDQETGR